MPRLWGITATDDQQIAGMIMKVVGGFYLWTVITVLFVRFAKGHGGRPRLRCDDRPPGPRPTGEDAILTWQQVQHALETRAPAPRESDLPSS